MKWYAALLYIQEKKEAQNDIFHGQGNIGWCLRKLEGKAIWVLSSTASLRWQKSYVRNEWICIIHDGHRVSPFHFGMISSVVFQTNGGPSWCIVTIWDETNDVYIQYSDITFQNDEMLFESIHEEHLEKPEFDIGRANCLTQIEYYIHRCNPMGQKWIMTPEGS